ncbi:hypothetical protein V5O48_001401 [Marasmius crinis-equi]|uniref:Uncharacterized protein n=1 Tax=Marasmius crinis-equi TaxID=585013 RepID=A0ABR3FZ47_9AGAR
MSEPPTPVDDDDELAILGGKTRLVKKEPSSPQMIHRSPTSHNPVVPLPLPSSASANVDPNVVEYLRSFQPSHDPPSAHSSYSDGVDTISPVSMYGLTTLPGPASAFHSESSSYNVQGSSLLSTSPSSRNGSQNIGINGGSHGNGFPQYFPVYDYGSSAVGNGYTSAPMLDANPVPHQRRSSSGSPEQNSMHSTWQDFVTDMAMN